MKSIQGQYLIMVLLCLFVCISPATALPFLKKKGRTFKKSTKEYKLNNRVSIDKKFASKDHHIHNFKVEINIPKSSKKSSDEEFVEVKYYYLEGEDEPLRNLVWESGKQDIMPIKVKTSEYFDEEEDMMSAYDHLAKGQRNMVETFYFPKQAVISGGQKIKKQKHKLKAVWDSADRAIVDIKPLLYSGVRTNQVYKKPKLSDKHSASQKKKVKVVNKESEEEVDLINKQLAEQKAKREEELANKKNYWDENSPEVPYSETISMEEFELRKQFNTPDDRNVEESYILGKDFNIESEVKRRQAKYGMEMQDAQKQMQVQMMMMGGLGGGMPMGGMPMGGGIGMDSMNNPFMSPQMTMMGMNPGMMGMMNQGGMGMANGYWPKMPEKEGEGYAEPDMSIPDLGKDDLKGVARDLLHDVKRSFTGGR